MVHDMLIISGVPLLRSVSGWLENSLSDGKIQFFEWKELVKTLLKLGIPTLALYYGFNLDPEIAASVPLIVVCLMDYTKKTVEKVLLTKTKA